MVPISRNSYRTENINKYPREIVADSQQVSLVPLRVAAEVLASSALMKQL